MRIGVMTGGAESLDAAVAEVDAAASAGLDSFFFGQMLGWDAPTLVALIGQRVPDIELGTAVVPTFSRHPLVLAGQALTARAATDNRFTLGVGPSHRALVEGQFGLDYDRPAAHTREYLTVLRSLLAGEEVDHRGGRLHAVGAVRVPGATPPPILLSALGPVMLRIAGELADGTVTTWVTPDGLADHVVPRITEAATAAGRGAPRVVAAVLAGVTADPAAVRRRLAERYGAAGGLPAYRATLERQGLSGVEHTALLGDEETVARGIREYAAAGATEVIVSPQGDAADRDRTLRLLATLRGASG